MKQIVIATGNKRKIGEARSSCDLFDIKVIPMHIDQDEIQSHDPIKITKQKAKNAFRKLKTPLVVNDAYWDIPSLNGFPGGYMKDVVEWFNAEDFIILLANKKDRRILCHECVIYIDDNITKLFNKTYYGEIAKEPKGMGNSIEEVAIFNGLTLAQHHDKNQYSEKAEDQVWYDFAKWYSTYESK